MGRALLLRIQSKRFELLTPFRRKFAQPFDVNASRQSALDSGADHLGFLPGLTPEVDGSPSVSRRWATEAVPKSGRLRSASSDISRTSPTVFRPDANSAFLMRVGNRTSRVGVLSGSSGVGSSSVSYTHLTLPTN